MNLDPLQAEPPPLGRLRFHTSQGPVEIELFSKETPKACRNIVQLSMEGFYDGLSFHRIMPDFIAQTGDPTGTGRGGTSIYAPLLPDGTAPDGKDLSRSDEGYFSDEFHPHLRFNKRGMLGMANANVPNTNQSQFFITLAPATELWNKHTLFGRVAGAGMYTFLALLEGLEIDDDGHPVPKEKAPRIERVEVVDNPFEDIVPRRSQAAKRAEQEKERAQAKAQRKAQRKAEEQAQLKAQTKKRKVLLSFGDEEEDSGALQPKPKKDKKPTSSDASTSAPVKLDKSRLAAPGLLDDPIDSNRSRSRSPSSAHPPTAEALRQPADQNVPSETTPHPKPSPPRPAPKQEIRDMEAALLGRSKDEVAPAQRDTSAAPDPSKRKHKERTDTARSWLAEQKAQYQKPKPKDLDVLAKLNSFRNQLKGAGQSKPKDAGSSRLDDTADNDLELDPDDREYGSSSDEDKETNGKSKKGQASGLSGWADLLGHKFQDTKHASASDALQPEDYAVLDPRGEEGEGTTAPRSRAREEKNRHAWARQVREDEDAEAMRRREERASASRSGMNWGRNAPSSRQADFRAGHDSGSLSYGRPDDDRLGRSRSDRGSRREAYGHSKRPDDKGRSREYGQPSRYGGRSRDQDDLGPRRAGR